MYEVFNYMTAETIGYVATEADAWYVIRNDSRPLDFLHWLESETPEKMYNGALVIPERPEPWCEHGTDPACWCTETEF